MRLTSLKVVTITKNAGQNIGLIDPISPVDSIFTGKIMSDILTIAQVCSRPVSITSPLRHYVGSAGASRYFTSWFASAILRSSGEENRLKRSSERERAQISSWQVDWNSTRILNLNYISRIGAEQTKEISNDGTQERLDPLRRRKEG